MNQNMQEASTVKTYPVSFIKTDGFINDSQCNIERAECVLRDLLEAYESTEEYQRQHNFEELNRQYSDVQIKLEIVYDYLDKLKKLTDDVNAYLDRYAPRLRITVDEPFIEDHGVTESRGMK